MNRRQTTVVPTLKPSSRRVKDKAPEKENLTPFVLNIKDPADFKVSPMFYKMILTGIQRKLHKLI
jgi:hypothetical protein